MIFFTIELIHSFSLNAQAPCSSFINPSLGNIDAVHVNNNDWSISPSSLYFYISMVQDYPFNINVISKLGQK